MAMTFDFLSCGFSHSEIQNVFKRLQPQIAALAAVVQTADYDSPYASLNLAYDNAYKQTIEKVVHKKRSLNPTILIIIGIGGSNLGTRAVQEALFGGLYNQKSDVIKVYYVDTVDSDYTISILTLAQQELEKKHAVLINVVTKSGTTTETIANFELFLELLLRYHPTDYAEYVVVTTDYNSKLWNLAEQKKYTLLEIPKNIGGRYSVFSAVGQFPLSLLNCTISKLLHGATTMIAAGLSNNLDANYPALSAINIYLQYKSGITIQDLFLFSVQCETVGKWYRQLMAESIGKEMNIHGQKVDVGITPTVSIGTIDLHSVGQLYLAGPRDKATTFVYVQPHHTVVVPDYPDFETVVAKIQGKSLHTIMQAILQGVKNTYTQEKRPFSFITIPALDEYYIGQFLQFKMVEIIYLGYLLEINPFDQPHVERYKEETRKILAKK